MKKRHSYTKVTQRKWWRGFCALPVFWTLFTFNFASAQNLQGSLLPTCNDNGEWPPYLYYERTNGEATDKVIGYDIDYLEKIFEEHDIDFTFELIAWSRCLHEVEKGEKYAMVSSVAYNKERDEKYLITDSYYTVQPHYFYVRHHFPDGLEIKDLASFADYRVCGLRGYNYVNFGIPVETIDVGTKVFPQLIEKTERKRCDVFLGRYEIFVGFAKTGTDYIMQHNLGTAPMPGVRGDKFYMMVSRNHPNAEALRDLLNEGIARVKASGYDRELIRKYVEG